MSLCTRKPTVWGLTRSDTDKAVESQKQARSLKFRIKEEEEVYYPCSKSKGADQLRGYLEADLRLCFRLCHAAAQMQSGVYRQLKAPVFSKMLR